MMREAPPQADEGADRNRDDDHQRADGQGHAAAMHDAEKHVAPERIGAQQEGLSRRRQAHARLHHRGGSMLAIQEPRR